jgi:hypothetical protein
MKQIFILFSLLLIISCKNASNNSSENTSFKKYSNVIEALKDANDFNEDNGTLKLLSEDTVIPKIQISKQIFEGDEESLIIEQTKRDLIYVIFQSFAVTDIKEIEVTSVPIKEDKTYDNKFKETIKVKREIAKSILKKYLNTESFEDLYKLEGTIYLPNEKFDLLKNQELKNIYNDLTNM